MALIVNVNVTVSHDDGTRIAQAGYGSQTFNPMLGDMTAEAELAKARARSLADQAIADVGGDLEAWASTVHRLAQKAGRSPADPEAIREQVEAQEGRCPLHAEDDPDAELLPGQPIALGWDGTTVLHADCAVAGKVPEGE